VLISVIALVSTIEVLRRNNADLGRDEKGRAASSWFPTAGRLMPKVHFHVWPIPDLDRRRTRLVRSRIISMSLIEDD